MKQLTAGFSVKYITSTNETVDGVIIDANPPWAHIEWGNKNLALAKYSEGKELNTFHFPEDGAAGVAAKVLPPKPFTPGAKASPEKPPTKPARKARPHQ